jgi:lipoprotein-anchoring transpeptidase ErfK/SrfK
MNTPRSALTGGFSSPGKMIGRRQFIAGGAGLGALALAGCATTTATNPSATSDVIGSPNARAMYAALPNEKFAIPAVKLDKLKSSHYRKLVGDPTGERPGTVVVDTKQRYLYLVRDDGTALRYGVGIGREGFAWSGSARIAAKRKWPTWTPPSEMIAREPELAQWRKGMPPSLSNPLGSRALYIFQDGRDTLYRLHGTHEVWSIGRAVSSGCVRLLNQDVIDLYDRVPVNTAIVVI